MKALIIEILSDPIAFFMYSAITLAFFLLACSMAWKGYREIYCFHAPAHVSCQNNAQQAPAKPGP